MRCATIVPVLALTACGAEQASSVGVTRFFDITVGAEVYDDVYMYEVYYGLAVPAAGHQCTQNLQVMFPDLAGGSLGAFRFSIPESLEVGAAVQFPRFGRSEEVEHIPTAPPSVLSMPDPLSFEGAGMVTAYGPFDDSTWEMKVESERLSVCRAPGVEDLTVAASAVWSECSEVPVVMHVVWPPSGWYEGADGLAAAAVDGRRTCYAGYEPAYMPSGGEQPLCVMTREVVPCPE